MQTKVTSGDFEVLEVDGTWNKVTGSYDDALPRALLKSAYRYFVNVPDFKLQHNVMSTQWFAIRSCQFFLHVTLGASKPYHMAILLSFQFRTRYTLSACKTFKTYMRQFSFMVS